MRKVLSLLASFLAFGYSVNAAMGAGVVLLMGGVALYMYAPRASAPSEQLDSAKAAAGSGTFRVTRSSSVGQQDKKDQ